MPKQAYARTKPHLNIGTIGHIDHGKTTLTSAITKILGARGTTASVPRDRLDGTPGTGRVEYETDTRHYAHLDLPGHPGLVENVIAGAARLDGAILVVSALEGVMPQTAEHLLLARRLGVEHIVVALNKADEGQAELTGLVELGIRDLLSAHGCPGGHIPVARVSALRALEGDPRWSAAIEALLDAVDTYVPMPVRYTDAPFLLPVESARTVPGRGTVVTGVIERGRVRVGDRVALPGMHGTCGVTGLETFGKTMDVGEAGDSVALLLHGVRRYDVRRGDVVAAPRSAVPRRHFTARVRLLSAAEGGRGLLFHLRTARVPGRIDLGARGTARPGETVTLRVELGRGVPLEPGLPFVIREGGRTVGTGTVTAVAEESGRTAQPGTIRGWTNRYP